MRLSEIGLVWTPLLLVLGRLLWLATVARPPVHDLGPDAD
jgi:hypothetical protein